MKYPLVKQDGLKDCGPCSLAMVIQYYGGYVGISYLEDLMHTTKNGTSAYNLTLAARHIGFESYGIKVDNFDNLEYPCIAHVTISNTYDHFVVIYKVDDKVLIGDPASKVKYMTKAEFNNIWNNIIVTLKPIRKLPYNKPKSLIRYIKDAILHYKYIFLYLIILSILCSFASLIYSILIKYMIDNISIFNDLVLIFIFLFTLKYILIYIKNKVNINLNKKISLYLSNGVHEKIISLPYVYYKNHRLGEVVTRFNDLRSIMNFINDVILSITLFPILILFLIFMYIESKILFIYILIVLLIYVILSYLLSKILNRNIINLKNEEANYNGFLVEILSAFETIKGINIERYMISKLNNKNNIYKDTLCNTENIYSIKEICLDIVLNIGQVFIIVLGFIMYSKNLLTLGTVISFYLLYSFIGGPISSIMNLFSSYKEAANASRRIQELDYSHASQKVSGGNILYKNVDYKSGIVDILKDINIKIYKGEKVFIMGESGSGKSSLMKILKGYYKTNNVYIGKDEVKNKLDNISYINQNEYLFEDTIKNNLLCDDDNKIKRVVDICLIKQNINTFIEENGFNISGGEKARIVLARALLKPFDILIIDEGFNELDTNSERIIMKNIFNYYKDKTIIVISHRLDNLDLFDHAIEISNGMVKKDYRKE